jgi:predicted AlkP superfamily pyrophosphatase or phosphodiesterase
MMRWCAALALLLSISAFARPPKLTLFISVDSLGSDVFQRNRSRFKYGFARLLNEGAYFPVAKYEVAECVTGAGHATLTTGAWPWRHGVVGNRFYNRATGKVEPIFADDKHPILDAPLGNDDVSPANLLAETLSDHLRASTALKGKSVVISGKGRSAVPMAGRLGDAWWFHEQVGRFVTGTWYRKEAPAWVKAFNDKKLPDTYQGKRWELVGAPKDYVGDDDRPFESDWYGMGRTFPHPLNGGLPSPGPAAYSALASSPMMSEVVVEFAKAALEGEQLGRDDVPDLLSISFSSLDRTYHLYGPMSWETQDSLVRLDKALGDLLAAAEKAAGGKQNLVVVLSADHGGANIPEEWAAVGLDGVRVAPDTIKKGLNEELEKKFGAANLLVAIDEVDLYLDPKVLEAKKLDGQAVRRAAAAWLGRQPDIQFAVARDDLDTLDRSGVAVGLRHSFHPDRSGDVLMVMKPFHVLESEARGTSHGTPWSYDAEVPLFLLGRGVKSGVYGTTVRTIDIAPTVSALMEMGSPAMNEGVVLSEALGLPR